MEEIISYKIAKLAKEKGFDEYTKLGNVTSLYDKKGNHVPYTNYGFMYSGLNDGYISAPTRSLLINWLREKHNLCIYIHHSIVSNNAKQCTYTIFGNKGVHIYHGKIFTNLAQIEEIAIEETLNLLPNV